MAGGAYGEGMPIVVPVWIVDEKCPSGGDGVCCGSGATSHLGGLQAPSWSSLAPGPACCCAQALTHKATFGFALLLSDASLPTLTPDSLRGLSGLPALTS